MNKNLGVLVMVALATMFASYAAKAQNVSIAFGSNSGYRNSIISPSGKYFVSFKSAPRTMVTWSIDRPFEPLSTVALPLDSLANGSPWSPVTFLTDSVLVIEMQGRVYQLLNLFDGSSRVYDANNLIRCLNRYNSGWVIPSSGKTWQAFNAETNTFDTVATNASEHFSGVLRSGEVVTRIDRTIRVFSKKGSLRTEIILPDSLGATSLFQVLYGRGFALSVANDHLFVMCDTNKIVEYDLKSGAAVYTIDAQFTSPGNIDVSPSGNHMFVATQKGEIALYDVKERFWVYKANTPSIVCSDPRFVNDTIVHVSSNGVDYTIDTRTWKWTPITMKSSNGHVGICGGGKAFYSGQHVLDTRDSTVRDLGGPIMEMQGTDLLGFSELKGPNDVRHKLYNRTYLFLVREYLSDPTWKLMGCKRNGQTIIETSTNFKEVRFRKMPTGGATQSTLVLGSPPIMRVKTLDDVDMFAIQNGGYYLYYDLEDYKPIYRFSHGFESDISRQPKPIEINTAIDSRGGLWWMADNDTCVYYIEGMESDGRKAAIPFDVVSYGAYGSSECILFGAKGEVVLLDSLAQVVDQWSLNKDLTECGVVSISANESMAVLGYTNRFETVSLSRTTSVRNAISTAATNPRAVAGTGHLTFNFKVRAVYDLQGNDCSAGFAFTSENDFTIVTQVSPTTGVFVIVGENGDNRIAQFQ